MTEPTRPTEPTTPLSAATPATEPMPAATPPPPGGAAGPVAPGGPGGPRRPGLWRQATSTTGGLVAVVVAAGLAALLVLGLLGLTGLVAARAIAGHHGPGHVTELRRGDGGGLMPGPRHRVDGQLPGGPGMPGPHGNQRGGQGGGGQGLGGLLGGTGALGGVQHGELTVQQNGKPVVVTVQRGTVTAVSATSLTVKSDDGFSATYSVDSATRRPAGLAKDDDVLVVARKSGAKAVVVRPVR